MAMELRSENPQFSSPRISFSHDLSQSDINEQRLLPSSVSSSTVDFDFNIPFDQQSSSAEDLFSGGVILPIDPKLKLQPPPPPPPPPRLDHSGEISAHKCEQNSNECAVSISSESVDQKQKSSKSSFWQFKRSNSFNCSNGYARTLCPIPLLSRSSSTGSASSSKKLSSSSPKECHPNHKQHLQKNPVLLPPIRQSQFPSSYQKPPLKRNCYGSSNGNGVRVNPVLNVPSANLFGLGSIFSGRKEKNKKK